ncbi:hypothetical protein F4819DRAFT_455026 [Hypoxylon fuscum]|nr:hypothetical protein F4819DRAFT_455026 [Hypoxylon fuscum]
MESTQDILRQYSDESLCKNPIHWTDRLLELLGCAFDVRLEDAARIANSLDRDMVANGTGRTTAERLADSHQKWHLIFVLLERCKLRTHWTGALFLYLGQVRVGLCSCYEFSLPDSSLPLVTSVNLDDIRHFREQSVVQPRCCYERRELPTQIAPPDPVRDPYIVSLITALAQKQALHRSTGERPLMVSAFSCSIISRWLLISPLDRFACSLPLHLIHAFFTCILPRYRTFSSSDSLNHPSRYPEKR